MLNYLPFDYGDAVYRSPREAEMRRRAEVQAYHRMKAQEECRRRAHQEKMYTEMMVQEELRRQRMVQEQHRMKAQEEARRRAHQERLHQEKLLNEELCRRRRMQEQRRLQPSQHRIVQDSNGAIYFIPAHQKQENGERFIEPTTRVVRGPSGKLYPVNNDEKPTKTDNVFHNEVSMMEVKQFPNQDEGVPYQAQSDRPTMAPLKKTAKKASSRRKVTVIVEDASDDENDGDIMKSVWRNRRPSPGQWIEPVEDHSSVF